MFKRQRKFAHVALSLVVCAVTVQIGDAQEKRELNIDSLLLPEGEHNAIWKVKGLIGYSPIGTTRIWCKQQGNAFVYLEEQSAGIFKGRPRLLVVVLGDQTELIMAGILAFVHPSRESTGLVTLTSPVAISAATRNPG